MPGYAISPKLEKPVIIPDPETIEELYDNVFYGFKYDPVDGEVIVEVINENEPIKLPESTSYKPYEYVHWFASPKNLNFIWDQSKGTHLLVEVT